MSKDIYYSSDRLFSHNAFINVVMGVRGGGKSFDAKRRAIRNFLKNKKQTIYVRRTRTEIDLVKKTYFNDIQSFFPDTEFKVEGDVGYINGEIGIIFLPLSVSSNFKSSSYPDVNLIVFDEYIIAESINKRYLKNEMLLFLELVETIFRMREGRILLLGNSISYVNPLFRYFDITIKDSSQRFHKFKNGLIVVELANNLEYLEEKKQTKFYKLLEGTKYSKYAFENEVLEDDYSYIIEKRPKRLELLCQIKYEKEVYSVWLTKEYNLYIDNITQDNTNKKFAVNRDEITEGYYSIYSQQGSHYTRIIKECFFQSLMYYKNITIKKGFINLIKHI